MRVTEVTYERLVNLGNYENERAQATVLLEEGDRVADGFTRARAEVLDALGLEEVSERKTVKKKTGR